MSGDLAGRVPVVTWPDGRAPAGLAVAPRAANPPGTFPVPAGRGRWRLTLHNRQWIGTTSTASTLIAELVDARGRRLDQAWNTAAQLTFTLNEDSPAAKMIVELTQDVMAWRWDDQTGADVCVFRGIITQGEDELTEQSATVTFTCHDYLKMFERRLVTSTIALTGFDQDTLANVLIGQATSPQASNGTSFLPGGFLPVYSVAVNPAGASRGASGILRDRTYPPQTVIYEALDDLARVISGFDYDILPAAGRPPVSPWPYLDALRIFYPYQGILRSSPALVYGSTVSGVTRTVNSGDYGNYWRVLGNNGSSDPAAPQLFSEAWNADSNDITRIPIGTWMTGDNAADVSIQSTLDQQAQGDLALAGLVVPSYSLTLRPGAYSWGNPNMGDVVPLVIQKGRLNVSTTVRVLGISYDIGDDGEEDVSLTVGRPQPSFLKLITAADRDVDALTRR
jgi:hypothetical protein